VIFDHVQKTVLVVANARLVPGDKRTYKEIYTDALARIAAVIAALQEPIAFELASVDLTREARPAYSSNFTKDGFEKAVLAAKEYIKSGDIFQVVLSQRLEATTTARPFDIYRALRVINPSPFMFYLSSPDCILAGSSPEIMCRVQDGVITNRPLAGTRKRGATEAEDKALEEDLLADPKERAEHIMLVDLGRNDVGRAAQLGSVQVNDVMTVERYSHVMHIVSNVTGKLAKDKTPFDALRLALPVGTVSGAPKIRAMQIIDELEPTKRGPYAGAVGYIDYNRNLDTCIALRTMVITPLKTQDSAPRTSWKIYVQAGAGLVADSVPASEYQECINKASALLKAVALAEQGLS
jgi:anthranilate synthase component 1